jgi:hypothetical protein
MIAIFLASILATISKAILNSLAEREREATFAAKFLRPAKISFSTHNPFQLEFS